MGNFERPNVFFSRCLGFEGCRYNGQMITNSFIESLKPYVNAITACPETSIGLSTPRDSMRIVYEKDELKLYQPKTGKEFTKEMSDFAKNYLKNLKNIDGFVLKSGSPSCSHKNVKIYNGISGVTRNSRGSGFFGGKVVELFTHAAIEDEGRLHNKNKLLIMANSQKYLKVLEKFILNYKDNPIEVILEEYEKKLKLAFKKISRYTNNINVLMHALGYFSNNITKGETELILDSLERYRQGKFTVNTPMLLIKSYAVRFNIDYLLEQTYFNPYPEELISLEDSGKINDLHL
jgi:uncharacterized protein YbgA (DUF1722 family)